MSEKRKDNKGRVLRTAESQRKRDGRYVYDYTDLTGKRKRIYAATLTELREKEKRIQRDLQDGINSRGGDITLNALFHVYMENKSDLRDTTRCNYLSMWDNRVENSDIGCMKISQIRQMHITSFYADLVSNGYAENTIKILHYLISATLEMAVDNDLIRKNPASKARKGVGGTKTEREALSRAEQAILMEFLGRENNIYSVYQPMISFALSTGLRVGELTGLCWKDVDFRKNVIHVRRQLIYKNLGDGCRFHIQALKTEAGNRDIPLTTESRASLAKQREYIRMLGEFKEKMVVDGESDFIFLNTKGRPYATNAVNHMLKNIVDAYNKREEKAAWREGREAKLLPHISAHILRHTACTRLAESGLDPKVLQHIMGHSDISVTMNTYTHLTEFDQVQEKMEVAQRKIG